MPFIEIWTGVQLNSQFYRILFGTGFPFSRVWGRFWLMWNITHPPTKQKSKTNKKSTPKPSNSSEGITQQNSTCCDISKFNLKEIITKLSVYSTCNPKLYSVKVKL